MRKFIVLLLILLGTVSLQAQKILTLKECYNMASTANALAQEKKRLFRHFKTKR